jgi:hypothetical protein
MTARSITLRPPIRPLGGLQMPQPIHLDDAELQAIMDAARPLQIHQRDGFLRAIAEELTKLSAIGPGALHRVIATVQRRHFDAPDLRVSSGKYR